MYTCTVMAKGRILTHCGSAGRDGQGVMEDVKRDTVEVHCKCT